MANRKEGRPSRYETEIKHMIPAVMGWYMKGVSKEKIAKELLGISVSTLYKYQNEHIEFSECFKKGKEVADYEVVNALHRNATGYWNKEEVVSTKKTVSYNEKGRRIEITEPVVVEINKWHPPNVTAQIYWTKNRIPQEFNDKKEVGAEISGSGGITFNIMPASQRPPEDEENEENV